MGEAQASMGLTGPSMVDPMSGVPAPSVWPLMIPLVLIAVMPAVVAAALDALAGPVALLGAAGIGAALVVGAGAAQRWFARRRAPRFESAVRAIERQADAGVLLAVARVRGPLARQLPQARTLVAIAGGSVWVGDRHWPAAAVTLTRPPRRWTVRAVELFTPSGGVPLEFVPSGDPSAVPGWSVDCELWPHVARALTVQQLGPTPPGWYPDPLDASVRWWWDGSAWGDRIE